MSLAADLYAEHLMNLGYGHPLWTPRAWRNSSPPLLGDVGFISEDGGFNPLFNMKYDRDHERNSGLQGVPEGHSPLVSPSNDLFERSIDGRLAPGAFCHEQSVKSEVEGEGHVGNGVVDFGAEGRYTRTKAAGALLYLWRKGDQTLCETNEIWENHIRAHFEAWENFFTRHGLRQKTMIIVRGFIRTSAWDAFAWNRYSSDGRVGAVMGLVGYGGGRILHRTAMTTSMFPFRGSFPPREYPQSDPSMISVHRPNDVDSLPADQTVFLSYYCIKRRILFRPKLVAAAGNHELPPPSRPDPDVGGGVQILTETLEDEEQWQNPLDQALQYLFERTDADVACVCDGDISSLMRDQVWPSDLYQKLVELSPAINVIDKVATFSIEGIIKFSHQRPIPTVPTGVVGATHPGDIPGSSDGNPSTSGDVRPSREQEIDLRDSSITLGSPSERCILRWPHTVLVDNAHLHQGALVNSVTISNDGQRVAIGFDDLRVLVWDVEDEFPKHTLKEHTNAILCTAFSPDSTRLASSSSDYQVILWSSESGEKECCFTTSNSEANSEVCCLTFSPDAKLLVTGSKDGSVKCVEIESLLEPGSNTVPSVITEKHFPAIQTVQYTPDGSHIIWTSGRIGTIWNTQSRQVEGNMRSHRGPIWCLAISHRGHRAATGSGDGTARIWKVGSGEELATIYEHRKAVHSVQFSPEDAFLVSGSDGGKVAIHDASTGECIHLFEGKLTSVRAVAYSPIGNIVVSGETDGVLKVWDATAGKQLAEVKGHLDRIRLVQFSPDSRRFISTSDDGTARVWSLIDILRVCS